MRILITGAGGPAAISVWKSLNAGHELHMADMDPCATGLYLVPGPRRHLVPRGDAEAFVPDVLTLCRRHKIELLVSTVDSELVPIAKRRSEIESSGTRVALPSLELLTLARDKAALLAGCEGVIPVPFSIVWTRETAQQTIQLPAFSKPRSGSGSRDLKKIDTEQDLKDLPTDGEFLVQEWLPGEEYSVDTYVSQAGHVLAAVPRIRMKTDSGIAITARTVHHQDVIDQAILLARHIGLRFVANIQFRRAVDGTPKLLEINPRFPGTLPITAAAGIDIPQLMVRDILGEPLPTALLPFNEVMAVRYWTEQICAPSEYEQLRQSAA